MAARDDTPIAVLSFYGRSGCGHCVHFKGLQKDGSLNKNSGWETLKRDPALLALPVRFDCVISPEAKFPADVQARINDPAYGGGGVPYLELTNPKDDSLHLPVPIRTLIAGWNADQCVPQIREWIQKVVSDPDYNRPPAPAAAVPEPMKVQARPQVVRQPAPVMQSQPMQVQSQESLIAKARASSSQKLVNTQERIPASAFGMGTREIQPPIIQQAPVEEVPATKAKSRFMPSNYDQ